jgi:signal transduction histidine kinase
LITKGADQPLGDLHRRVIADENATAMPLESSARGLRSKIGTAFILQASAISCATLLGIYASATVLEDVLIRRALNEEAAHYFKLVGTNPHASTPNTYNMRGYFTPVDGFAQSAVHESVPAALRDLTPGYHNIKLSENSRPLVYIKESPFGRLTLVFDQQNVGKLALLFGLVPMVVVLLFIYLASFAAYRLSKRAISPVIWLANQVSKWNTKTPEASLFDAKNLPVDIDGESQVLAEALTRYSQRIHELVERERTFTRDASHELRTPLSVIKMASEVLLSETENDAFAERNLKRIEAACRDMEALIEAFLLLARDSESGMPEELFSINQIVHDEVQTAEPLLTRKDVHFELRELCQLRLYGPPRVASVMVGNLIRNACKYTDAGTVTITIDAKSVIIADTGAGMSHDDLNQIFQPFFRAAHAPRGGHGVGLTIVRRLSDRFKWPVQITSELGVGTKAIIEFPKAEIASEPADRNAVQAA